MKIVRLVGRYSRPTHYTDPSAPDAQRHGAYQTSGLFNNGELARFPDAEADALIAAGRALLVMPDA